MSTNELLDRLGFIRSDQIGSLLKDRRCTIAEADTLIRDYFPRAVDAALADMRKPARRSAQMAGYGLPVTQQEAYVHRESD